MLQLSSILHSTSRQPQHFAHIYLLKNVWAKVNAWFFCVHVYTFGLAVLYVLR